VRDLTAGVLTTPLRRVVYPPAGRTRRHEPLSTLPLGGTGRSRCLAGDQLRFFGPSEVSGRGRSRPGEARQGSEVPQEMRERTAQEEKRATLQILHWPGQFHSQNTSDPQMGSRPVCDAYE